MRKKCNHDNIIKQYCPKCELLTIIQTKNAHTACPLHRIVLARVGFSVGGGNEMATDRFLEALKKPSRIKYEGADLVPGTDKVRTYFSNGSLYSKESDIKTILSNERRAFGARKER